MTPDAAVVSFEADLREAHGQLLLAPRVPSQLVFADLVGLDTLAWVDVVGTHQVQDLVHGVVPRVNGHYRGPWTEQRGTVSPSSFPSDRGKCTLSAKPSTGS